MSIIELLLLFLSVCDITMALPPAAATSPTSTTVATGQCEANPCGPGRCEEFDTDVIEEGFICRCEGTRFTGQFCQKDIGKLFNLNDDGTPKQRNNIDPYYMAQGYVTIVGVAQAYLAPFVFFTLLFFGVLDILNFEVRKLLLAKEKGRKGQLNPVLGFFAKSIYWGFQPQIDKLVEERKNRMKTASRSPTVVQQPVEAGFFQKSLLHLQHTTLGAFMDNLDAGIEVEEEEEMLRKLSRCSSVDGPVDRMGQQQQGDSLDDDDDDDDDDAIKDSALATPTSTTTAAASRFREKSLASAVTSRFGRSQSVQSSAVGEQRSPSQSQAASPTMSAFQSMSPSLLMVNELSNLEELINLNESRAVRNTNDSKTDESGLGDPSQSRKATLTFTGSQASTADLKGTETAKLERSSGNSSFNDLKKKTPLKPKQHDESTIGQSTKASSTPQQKRKESTTNNWTKNKTPKAKKLRYGRRPTLETADILRPRGKEEP